MSVLLIRRELKTLGARKFFQVHDKAPVFIVPCRTAQTLQEFVTGYGLSLFPSVTCVFQIDNQTVGVFHHAELMLNGRADIKDDSGMVRSCPDTDILNGNGLSP